MRGRLSIYMYKKPESECLVSPKGQPMESKGTVSDSKTVMINTLTWLVQTEGASGGGILATHPRTQERIDALKKV